MTGNNAKLPFTNIKNPIQDAVHQSIVVDTPNGQRAFSFGASGISLSLSTEWFEEKSMTATILEGTVYESNYTSGRVSSELQTTPEQDKQFLNYLLSYKGKTAGYSVGRHNCRKFSQLMFQRAKNMY